MSAVKHRRGEESDALAALSRALRAGTLPPLQTKQPDASPPVVATPPVAAAVPVAAVAAPAAAPARNTPNKEKKEKKVKKEKKEKKEKMKKEKKRKHGGGKGEEEGVQQQRLRAELQPADSSDEEAAPSGSAGLTGGTMLLQRLELAAAELQPAASSGQAVLPLLSELATCAAQLGALLAAAGVPSPPSALRLLEQQLQQLQTATASMPLPLQLAPATSALGLQARAAAAAVKRQLAGMGGGRGSVQQQAQQAQVQAGTAAGSGAPLPPPEQQRFSQWFLPTFADCYAAEVEALQESEPPIPAGVLLQCVRLAAEGGALFPPHLKRLVLTAAAAAATPA